MKVCLAVLLVSVAVSARPQSYNFQPPQPTTGPLYTPPKPPIAPLYTPPKPTIAPIYTPPQPTIAPLYTPPKPTIAPIYTPPQPTIAPLYTPPQPTIAPLYTPPKPTTVPTNKPPQPPIDQGYTYSTPTMNEEWPYNFQWAVQDGYSGNDFSQMVNSDGRTTQGEYRVLLPDGRTQVVKFVDNGAGYNADINYEK